MKALFALALLLSLTLAGCGGAPEPVVPPQDAEGRYVIHMNAANRFTPTHAKVPVGATVLWINDGGVHDVTADDDSWSSDDAAPAGLGQKIPSGQSFQRTFTAAGEVGYHCALHRSSGMTGTLVVE